MKTKNEKDSTKTLENSPNPDEFVPKDGGIHAWIVMTCCFVINGLFQGVVDSYGELFVHLKEKYQDDENVSMKVSLGEYVHY